MEAWHVWLIIAIVLGISEMLLPGFVLICFALGALITSVCTGLVQWLTGNPFGLNAQIATFCIANLIVFVSLRKVFLNLLHREGREHKTNVDRLIGQVAVVTKRIPAGDGRGRVKIGGEEWGAICERGWLVEEGERVKVKNIDGNKLVVEKK